MEIRKVVIKIKTNMGSSGSYVSLFLSLEHTHTLTHISHLLAAWQRLCQITLPSVSTHITHLLLQINC